MQRLTKIVLILALLLFVTACQKKESDTLSLESAELVETRTDEGKSDENKKEFLYVYVCGAVYRSGVYELPVGSRVFEAIEMAGGFREDADTKTVNQAELLQDEQQVYVPVIGETVDNSGEENGKININKASREELMSLPGVGASRAESIIRYRNEQGAFQKIEDIMQVSGIKEGLFEKIKDLITV